MACRICRIASGGPGTARVYEDDELVVVLTMAGGRIASVLVIPKTHTASLEALAGPVRTHLVKTSERATASLGDLGTEFDGADLQVVGEDHAHLRVSACN